jgi:hypothetical protein
VIALFQFIHWIAAFVVLAEALNKLERSCPLAPGMSWRGRVVVWLKVLAWMLLAFGAGIGLASPMLLALGWPGGSYVPFLKLESPTEADAMVMAGFAVLIVRTRVKEG